MNDGSIRSRGDGSGMARWSAMALVLALGLVGCKPAPCGPTRDVRHRTKVAVERYPASGDETRAVLKELTTALAAQPEAKTLQEWSSLTTSTSEFAAVLVDMNNPNLDEKRRQSVGAVMTQRKEHLLRELNVVRDQCGE